MKHDYESIRDALTSPSLLAISVGAVMVLSALLGVVAAAASKLWPLRIVRCQTILIFVAILLTCLLVLNRGLKMRISFET